MKIRKTIFNQTKNKKDLLLYLKKAILTIFNYHKHNKTILFVGNFSNKNKMLINKKLLKNHIFLLNSNWIYGILTNKNSFIKSLQKNNDKRLKDYNLQKYITKKKKPDLIVILSMKNNQDILKEALKLKIPTISLIDNNFNDFVLYPIKINTTSKIKNYNFIFYLLNSILKKK